MLAPCRDLAAHGRSIADARFGSGGRQYAARGERQRPHAPAADASRADARLPARDARRRAHVRGDGRRCIRARRSSRCSTTQQGMGERFAGHVVHTSALQRLGARQENFRRLLPLYPIAVERLSLPPADVVLSSSSAFAHGVRVPDGAVHVCYCHAPFRYAWYEQDASAAPRCPARCAALLRLQLHRMRRWDLAASRRVDSLHRQLASSRKSASSASTARESTIIHPPVETERFAIGTPGESLLVVSELVAHKRVRVALEAARRARAPISVVGSGPDHAALSAAYPEARFLGRAGDEELARLYVERARGGRRERRGVRDHRGRGAGGRQAGDRGRRRRRARDGDRRRDGPAGGARRRRRASRARSPRSTGSTSTRRAPCATPRASR